MNCGLYIGCGADFDPTEQLKNARKFIYIDSQPLTSHGDLYQAFTPQDKQEFYNKNYMKEFMDAATETKNYNTNQEVYHYYSLCFPIISFKRNPTANQDEILKLVHQLNQVTHLIVRGYSPNYNIFRYIPRKVVFVAYDDTIYLENLNNLLPSERKKVTVLLQLDECRQHISNYIYLRKDNKIIFTDYDNFIGYVKSH